MKNNPFTKWIILFVAVVLIILLVRGGSDDESNSEGSPPPRVTNSGPQQIGLKDSAQTTLTTLVQKDSERKREVDEINTKLDSLQSSLESGVKGSGMAPEEKKELLDKLNEMNQEIQSLKENSGNEQIAALSSKVNKAIDGFQQNLDANKGATFVGKPKNPLNSGYEIGGQAGAQDISLDSEGTVWINPIDTRVSYDKEGRFIPNSWNEKQTRTVEDQSELSKTMDKMATKVVAKSGVNGEEEGQPVFTIPENTTIVGARLASRMLAMVPKGGSVANPKGFKMIMPKKVLAANGFDIPGVEQAFIGGYAVGQYSLECANGYITSMTFVFEDGHIAQIGTNLSNAGGQDAISAQTLGVVTDIAGTECIAGKYLSDTPEFIASTTALSALSVGAAAYSSAQTTTQSSGDNVNSSVTGNVGKYMAGEGVNGAVNQINNHISELWNSTYDTVLVDIDTPVNIEIKKQININYNPNSRKVSYDFSIDDSNSNSAARYWNE